MSTTIARLHFVTSPSNKHSIFSQIQQVVLGGCNWVQLKMDDEPDNEVEQIAIQALSFCMDNGASLIITDRIELAARIGADGVYLERADLSPSDARKVLGPQVIIGASANSYDDIENLVSQKVDYILLGPLRLASNSKDEQSILGTDGYKTILQQCKSNGITTPIVAYGHLEPNDFKDLFEAGMHGVALSSFINQKEQPGAVTLELMQIIGRLSSAAWLKNDKFRGNFNIKNK